MSKELVRTGQRMYELTAKLEAEQRAERTARPVPSPPAVFLEWGACAVRDLPFYTRIERQSSGLYLRVACMRAQESEDYGGAADSRVLRLDQIKGAYKPCPWCGADRGLFACYCGLVCGGRVDKRRVWFRCRDSCGEVWQIGEPSTETHVTEEARCGQWKAPARDGGLWQAPGASDPNRLRLPPARRK